MDGTQDQVVVINFLLVGIFYLFEDKIYHYKWKYEMQNRVVEGGGKRALSALRGPFLDSRRTFTFAYSATVPTCYRRRPGRTCTEGPARGLVRPESSQSYAKPAKRRCVCASF